LDNDPVPQPGWGGCREKKGDLSRGELGEPESIPESADPQRAYSAGPEAGGNAEGLPRRAPRPEPPFGGEGPVHPSGTWKPLRQPKKKIEKKKGIVKRGITQKKKKKGREL